MAPTHLPSQSGTNLVAVGLGHRTAQIQRTTCTTATRQHPPQISNLCSDFQSVLDQIEKPSGIISPLHSPPVAKPKRRKRNQNTKRGNNLVILPTPSKEHVRRKSTTAVLSSSKLPPPHPMSPVQSYPSHGQTRHATIARSDSTGSVDGSETGSEATPIISPGKIPGGCYSYSFDSGDERTYSDDGECDIVKEGSEEQHVSMQGAPLLAPLSDSTGKELQGLTISFVDESDESKRCELDPHDQLTPTSKTNHANRIESTHQSNDTGQIAITQGNFEMNRHAVSPLLFSPSLNPSLSPTEAPQQVFSSDTLFFEGIHNSGLQSTSFEHVTDRELSSSTTGNEIELVFDGSFEANDDRSVDEKSADMSRRVELWRKSRLRNSDDDLVGSSDGDDGENCAKIPNGNLIVDAVEAVKKEIETSAVAPTCGLDSVEDSAEETFGVEMAPLTKSRNGSMRAGDHPPRSAEINQSSRYFTWQWRFRHPLTAIRNYLWRMQIESAPTLEAIREDHNSPSVPGLIEDNDEPMQRSLTRMEDGDCDERRSLTSSIHRSPLRTARRYDDVDFDRTRSFCCHCIAEWCVSRNERDPYGLIERETYKMYTGWKKPCLVSLFMLLLAWLVTAGRLEKHHFNYQSLDDSQDDPLAREHFVERDGDDYYLLPLKSPADDDDAFHSFEKQIIIDQFRTDDEYDILQPNIREHDFASSTADRYSPMTFNDYVGIDTISVVGER